MSDDTRQREVLAAVPTGLLVDGEWVPARSGATFGVEDPATGEVLTKVADAIGLNQGVVSNAAAPFGGVKHSGFGREGGPEGVDEYLQTKYVAVTLPRLVRA